MTKDINSIKKKLQWASIILILISALPCLLIYINIPPVIQYAIDTQKNVGLQLFVPLLFVSCLTGISLVLLFISLIIRDKS